MPISFPHLLFKYTSICGIFLFCMIGTCVRGHAQPSITTARRRATRRYRLGRCPRIYSGHALYIEPPESTQMGAYHPISRRYRMQPLLLLKKKTTIAPIACLYDLWQ